ncbi:hypothetical protein DFJ73DRAFT_907078 [Zopfochytrium polystomum]|nr:hypothetical protein DFJ73DRAFT_907078 [Zopfochytrium polystomum]
MLMPKQSSPYRRRRGRYARSPRRPPAAALATIVAVAVVAVPAAVAATVADSAPLPPPTTTTPGPTPPPPLPPPRLPPRRGAPLCLCPRRHRPAAAARAHRDPARLAARTRHLQEPLRCYAYSCTGAAARCYGPSCPFGTPRDGGEGVCPRKTPGFVEARLPAVRRKMSFQSQILTEGAFGTTVPPANILAVLYLKHKLPPLPTLVDTILTRLVARYPRFRSLPVEVNGEITWAELPVSEVSLMDHITQLDLPTPADVTAKLESLLNHFWDPTRPLWHPRSPQPTPWPPQRKSPHALWTADTPSSIKAPHLFTRFDPRHRIFTPRPLPLPAVKRVKSAVPGATVNDVVLALLAGAYRRYPLARTDPAIVPDLAADQPRLLVRAGSAISLPRPPPSPDGGVGGLHNRFVYLSAGLPGGAAAAVQIASQRFTAATSGRGVLASLTYQFASRHSVGVSNLRGPEAPLAVCGVEVERIVPIVSSPANTWIVFSYCDLVYFSCNVVPKLYKDLGLLERCFELEFQDMLREIE